MFHLSIAAAVILGHVYLHFRLVRTLLRIPSHRKAAAIVLTLLALSWLMRLPIRSLHPSLNVGFSMFIYAYLAVAFSFVLAVFAVDLGRLAIFVGETLKRRAASKSRPALAAPPEGEPAEVPELADPDLAAGRRAFVRKTAGWVALAGGGGLSAYTTMNALIPPSVTEVVVRIPRLPRTLDGFTIVQLTDIHVGNFIGRDFIDHLVASTNATRPDLVAITGDLVDGSVARLGPAVSGLGALEARFGTYFVTGNHEYYSGVDPWVEFVDSLGIAVLRNRRVEIGDGGGGFDLVGVDDWSGSHRVGGQGYDLEAAMVDRDDQRAAILLAHQPMGFYDAHEQGIDLQISGHTHGGQFFPMTELVKLRYEFTRGIYQRGDGHIFVSRGCGFWGPPTRAGATPEIAKIILTT